MPVVNAAVDVGDANQEIVPGLPAVMVTELPIQILLLIGLKYPGWEGIGFTVILVVALPKHPLASVTVTV